MNDNVETKFSVFQNLYKDNKKKYNKKHKIYWEKHYKYWNSKEAGTLIKVFYSRPQLKGRTVGKDLAPYGKLWRTGANDATEIILFTDMKLGNTTVKAGTYSLFTIPTEKEWTIIISSDTNNWSTSGYKESNEVARVTVPATRGDESVEAFAITFDNEGTMHLGWGNIRVAVPFTKA